MKKQFKSFKVDDLIVYKGRIYKIFCASTKYQYAQVRPYNHDYYGDILPSYIVHYRDIEPLGNKDIQLRLL